MSIKDGHNKKVSFDTKEESGDKIDKLAVMIGKLATRDSGTGRQFKPQIYQNRGGGQNRNYNQRNYQNRFRSNSGDRGQDRQDRGRPRYKQNYRRHNFRGNMRNYVDKIVEESIETIIEMTVMTEAGTGLEKDCFPEIMATIEIGVQATAGPGQDPEQVQIETEFNVISVENTISSQRTVPLLEKKRKKKFQQMINLGDGQTS